MHLGPIVFQDAIPALVSELRIPVIHGAAELAHRAYAGAGLPALLDFIARPAATEAEDAALALDSSLAYRLAFQKPQADALQCLALAQCSLFRVAAGPGGWSARPLRVLALVAPGDLMVNTPLEFIVRHMDVRLDLLFVQPGRVLPRCVPDHDVAFFAVSESDPAALERLRPLYREWPRPVLNDPAAVARLSRDVVAAGLDGLPGVCSPVTRRLRRAEAIAMEVDRPLLIRPVGTHAGDGLEAVEDAAGLADYLHVSSLDAFFVTDFVDYRGPDGKFRKYRVAFLAGFPVLCHMAVSSHWMVHYLNAEMARCPERRAEEAAAMAGFDTGFARRHGAALDAVAAWLGLDYAQIDCAETPDGRLLVFEADTAAIVHLMDPPEVFPYKPAQMRRLFAGFETLLRRAAGGRYEMSLATSGAAR